MKRDVGKGPNPLLDSASNGALDPPRPVLLRSGDCYSANFAGPLSALLEYFVLNCEIGR